VISAGCDLALLCSGNVADTESVAAAVPLLDGRSLARFERARAAIGQQQPLNVAEAEAGLARILAASA
jgi:beta-N-acetylhexosaminidase